MKIDFSSDDHWNGLNEILSQKLGITNKAVAVRSYVGLSHGLNEIVRGLVRLFPHKKSYAVIVGCGPYFDPLSPILSMEGLNEQKIELKDLKNSPDWFQKLNKDTLFLLSSFDDPITGEIFDLSGVRKLASDQKMMTVTLYHHHHQYHALHSVLPTEACLLSLVPNLSIGILGSRTARVQSLIYGFQNWAIMPPAISLLETPKKEKQELVETFESEKWGGFEPFFPKGSTRVFDRAVFYWRDMDGEAFVQELNKEMSRDWKKPGLENLIETTSLCRWGGLKTFDWYSAQGHDHEKMRGLIVLSADLLDQDLGPKIDKARQRVLKLQNGSEN